MLFITVFACITWFTVIQLCSLVLILICASRAGWYIKTGAFRTVITLRECRKQRFYKHTKIILVNIQFHTYRSILLNHHILHFIRNCQLFAGSQLALSLVWQSFVNPYCCVWLQLHSLSQYPDWQLGNLHQLPSRPLLVNSSGWATWLDRVCYLYEWLHGLTS